MKSPKKLVAVLVAFAFVVFLAASVGVNATPPGDPMPGEPETHEEFESVESQQIEDAESGGICMCWVWPWRCRGVGCLAIGRCPCTCYCPPSGPPYCSCGGLETH